MKRSGCLVRLRPPMSWERRRDCSKVSTRWVACPLWDSQIMASQGMGAPSIFSWRAQVCGPWHTSALSRLSTDLALLSLESLAFFCCLAPFWGATSPSSKSLTGLFFLRFRLACSLRSVGGWGRRRETRRNLGLGDFFWSWPLVPVR